MVKHYMKLKKGYRVGIYIACRQSNMIQGFQCHLRCCRLPMKLLQQSWKGSIRRFLRSLGPNRRKEEVNANDCDNLLGNWGARPDKPAPMDEDK